MTIRIDAVDRLVRLASTGYQRWRLVRAFPLAMVLLLSVALPACGGTDESDDARTEPATSATTPAVAGLSQAAPDNPAAVGDVRGLAFDPASGNPIAVTSTGLVRWSGADQEWEATTTSTDLDWESVNGVAINPDNPANLYIYGTGIGVLRSDDGGQGWQAVTAGLPSDDVGALAMHSNKRDTLFAWIEGQGVFRTEDGGEQWEMMDKGPDSSAVRALTHSPLEGSMNTGWLYAATPEGVYLSMDCF